MNVKGAPEKANEETRDEVADGVDGGKGAEGHAVLLLGDEFGGERIFQSFFRADVKARKDKNQPEQPQGTGSGAKENRGDGSEGVAGGEHRLAAGNVVAEPAAQVRGTCIENVVQGIEPDGEACGASHAVARGQRARGVKDQQGV